MELYYQNETLYIDLNEDLDEFTYRKLKHKIFRIIEDYGVDRIVLHSKHQIFTNRHFVRQMKHDYESLYQGEFLIR